MESSINPGFEVQVRTRQEPVSGGHLFRCPECRGRDFRRCGPLFFGLEKEKTMRPNRQPKKRKLKIRKSLPVIQVDFRLPANVYVLCPDTAHAIPVIVVLN